MRHGNRNTQKQHDYKDESEAMVAMLNLYMSRFAAGSEEGFYVAVGTLIAFTERVVDQPGVETEIMREFADLTKEMMRPGQFQ